MTTPYASPFTGSVPPNRAVSPLLAKLQLDLPHLVGRPPPLMSHFGTIHRVGPIRIDASRLCAWSKVATAIMADGSSA